MESNFLRGAFRFAQEIQVLQDTHAKKIQEIRSNLAGMEDGVQPSLATHSHGPVPLSKVCNVQSPVAGASPFCVPTDCLDSLGGTALQGGATRTSSTDARSTAIPSLGTSASLGPKINGNRGASSSLALSSGVIRSVSRPHGGRAGTGSHSRSPYSPAEPSNLPVSENSILSALERATADQLQQHTQQQQLNQTCPPAVLGGLRRSPADAVPHASGVLLAGREGVARRPTTVSPPPLSSFHIRSSSSFTKQDDPHLAAPLRAHASRVGASSLSPPPVAAHEVLARRDGGGEAPLAEGKQEGSVPASSVVQPEGAGNNLASASPAELGASAGAGGDPEGLLEMSTGRTRGERADSSAERHKGKGRELGGQLSQASLRNYLLTLQEHARKLLGVVEQQATQREETGRMSTEGFREEIVAAQSEMLRKMEGLEAVAAGGGQEKPEPRGSSRVGAESRKKVDGASQAGGETVPGSSSVHLRGPTPGASQSAGEEKEILKSISKRIADLEARFAAFPPPGSPLTSVSACGPGGEYKASGRHAGMGTGVTSGGGTCSGTVAVAGASAVGQGACQTERTVVSAVEDVKKFCEEELATARDAIQELRDELACLALVAIERGGQREKGEASKKEKGVWGEDGDYPPSLSGSPPGLMALSGDPPHAQQPSFHEVEAHGGGEGEDVPLANELRGCSRQIQDALERYPSMPGGSGVSPYTGSGSDTLSQSLQLPGGASRPRTRSALADLGVWVRGTLTSLATTLDRLARETSRHSSLRVQGGGSEKTEEIKDAVMNWISGQLADREERTASQLENFNARLSALSVQTNSNRVKRSQTSGEHSDGGVEGEGGDTATGLLEGLVKADHFNLLRADVGALRDYAAELETYCGTLQKQLTSLHGQVQSVISAQGKERERRVKGGSRTDLGSEHAASIEAVVLRVLQRREEDKGVSSATHGLGPGGKPAGGSGEDFEHRMRSAHAEIASLQRAVASLQDAVAIGQRPAVGGGMSLDPGAQDALIRAKSVLREDMESVRESLFNEIAALREEMRTERGRERRPHNGRLGLLPDATVDPDFDAAVQRVLQAEFGKHRRESLDAVVADIRSLRERVEVNEDAAVEAASIVERVREASGESAEDARLLGRRLEGVESRVDEVLSGLREREERERGKGAGECNATTTAAVSADLQNLRSRCLPPILDKLDFLERFCNDVGEQVASLNKQRQQQKDSHRGERETYSGLQKELQTIAAQLEQTDSRVTEAMGRLNDAHSRAEGLEGRLGEQERRSGRALEGLSADVSDRILEARRAVSAQVAEVRDELLARLDEKEKEAAEREREREGEGRRGGAAEMERMEESIAPLREELETLQADARSSKRERQRLASQLEALADQLSKQIENSISVIVAEIQAVTQELEAVKAQQTRTENGHEGFTGLQPHFSSPSRTYTRPESAADRQSLPDPSLTRGPPQTSNGIPAHTHQPHDDEADDRTSPSSNHLRGDHPHPCTAAATSFARPTTPTYRRGGPHSSPLGVESSLRGSNDGPPSRARFLQQPSDRDFRGESAAGKGEEAHDYGYTSPPPSKSAPNGNAVSRDRHDTPVAQQPSSAAPSSRGGGPGPTPGSGSASRAPSNGGSGGPRRVEWRIDRLTEQIRKCPWGHSIWSPKFTASGLNGCKLQFFPQGGVPKQIAEKELGGQEGFGLCSLWLWVPDRVRVQYTLFIGRQKQRLESVATGGKSCGGPMVAVLSEESLQETDTILVGVEHLEVHQPSGGGGGFSPQGGPGPGSPSLGPRGGGRAGFGGVLPRGGQFEFEGGGGEMQR